MECPAEGLARYSGEAEAMAGVPLGPAYSEEHEAIWLDLCSAGGRVHSGAGPERAVPLSSEARVHSAVLAPNWGVDLGAVLCSGVPVE